jgi:uncharacterized protein YjbI with pentapeptide repeats
VRFGGSLLHRTRFGGADLFSADLRGADLKGARELTPSQLSQAVTDKLTILPNGQCGPFIRGR